MNENNFQNFRIILMQEYLPIGLAIFKKVKAGNIQNIVNSIKDSNFSLANLRSEGEDMAKNVRDQLDQIQDGLGNPAVSVDFKEESNNSKSTSNLEINLKLIEIEKDLQELKRLLSTIKKSN